jgi:DNA-binding MarR family transcriptional regulator
VMSSSALIGGASAKTVPFCASCSGLRPRIILAVTVAPRRTVVVRQDPEPTAEPSPLDRVSIDAYTSDPMPPSRPDRVSELSARVAMECAGGGLRRASRAISRFYEAAFAPLDLTATQFSILVAVQLSGSIPLSRLAEALVLDRTSLYRAVKPLVRRRCLRILPGQTRRERTTTLTEVGRRLLADALPIWERIQGQVVGALGRRWAALSSGLRQIVPTVRALESGKRVAATPARRRAGHS